MIECLKIEDFVITQMLFPYISNLISEEFQGFEYCKELEQIEKKLRKNPEYIIELLEEHPDTKKNVFERLNRCGGVKFYRYLNMECDVIQYIKAELPNYQITTYEKVKQLREMTGAGMMDCKRALEKTNADVEKADELIRSNSWRHGKLV